MKIRTFICPETNVSHVLSQNLYTHNRGHAGKWRYKGDQGTKDIWFYINELEPDREPHLLTIDQAIKAADTLNTIHGQNKTEKAKSFLKGAIEREVARYIEERNSRAPHKVDTPVFKREEGYLNEFASDLRNYSLSSINRHVLYDWFYGERDFAYRQKLRACTHDAQKNRRKALSPFFDYLLGLGTLKHVQYNHFKFNSVGEFKCNAKKPTQGGKGKARRDIMPNQLKGMHNWCMENNKEWFADILELAFLTGARRSDIAALKVEHFDFAKNTLAVRNIKKFEQTGVKAANIFSISNEEMQPLAILLQRMINRAKSHNCPYIACEPYGRYGKKKDHPCQVTSGHITKTFENVRSNFPDMCWKEQDFSHPPSFHEIRGLFGRIAKAKGMSDEHIQDQYMHEAKGMTAHYLASDLGKVNVVTKCVALHEINDDLLDPDKLLEAV